MTSAWRAGRIAGVWRRSTDVLPDERGSFAELWRASWIETLPRGHALGAMRQANVSRSQARVLRGLHMHLRQADLWVVLDGSPLVALVDTRPALLGNGPVVVEMIDAVPGDVLFIPEGVAHGFYARDPITLVYLVTNEYDGSDELGLAWDDEQAAVPWPDRSPILSARDGAAGPLADLLTRLRRESQQSSER